MATPDTARARVWWGALVASAIGAGCATTPGPDDLLVRDIRIEGTEQLSEGKVKAKILTTEPFWPWDVEIFDSIAWQADLRRIERFYEAEGYYQAQILEEEVIPVGDGVELRVRVQEGEPTRLAEIRIEGLAPLTEAQRETLLEGFPLKEGEILREEEWLSVKPLLEGRLREMAYAEAVVEGTVEVDVETQLARALIEVQPGQRYRIDEIFISTQDDPKVRPQLIREQARLALPKGAWYSDSAIAEAHERIFKMGVFGGVKVNRAAVDREKGTVIVVVDTTEAPFHTVRAGGGVGLDQTRNEVRLLLEYTDRNFFGGLRSLTTQVRAGYALLPNALAVLVNDTGVVTHHEPLANVTAEFSQPRVFHPTLRYFVAVEGEWRPELAFTLGGGQAKTGLAWAPSTYFVGKLTYNVEAYRFFRGQAFLGGRTTELAIGCPRTCVVSFPEAELAWDRRMRRTPGGLRHDPIDPTTGYYLGLSVQYGQYGGSLRAGDASADLRFFPFMRLTPEARAYTSFFGDRLTLGARARAGALVVREDSQLDSPIFIRYYAGGANSMRGYNARRLSPLQLIPPDPPRDRDPLAAPAGELGRQVGEAVPIGGERLFEGSLEGRYRLNSDFTLAVFTDAGFNNRDPAREQRDALLVGREVERLPFLRYLGKYMQYAVGFGLRYLTVVGPIRVDLAYRLPFGTPPSVSQTPGSYLVSPPGGGCFGLWQTPGTSSSNPEGSCALHVSIGEAF